MKNWKSIMYYILLILSITIYIVLLYKPISAFAPTVVPTSRITKEVKPTEPKLKPISEPVEAKPKPIEVKPTEPKPKPISEPVEAKSASTGNTKSTMTFKITAYCPCKKCCGKSDGITSTGTVATQGRTIAVDPSVIPYGSIVIIDGVQYVAEDCGVKGNTIDIFFNSHTDALNYGIQYHDVCILK